MFSIGSKFTQVRTALLAGAAGLVVSAAFPGLLHGQSKSDTLKVDSVGAFGFKLLSGEGGFIQLSPAQIMRITAGIERITAGADSLTPEALQEIQREIQKAFPSAINGGGKVIQLGPVTRQMTEAGSGPEVWGKLQNGPKGVRIVPEASAADSAKADSAGKGSKMPAASVAPPAR